MNEVRKIRIQGDVAYVPLTKGLEAIIDACDVGLVGGSNWYAHAQVHTAYARREDCSGRKRRTMYMHRVILGVKDGIEVDHIDGNGLNNRRGNLREASRSQNNQNRATYKNSTSGVKGVNFHKKSGKWHARVHANGKCFSLGLFSSANDAHAAYCKAKAELHSAFGRN